MFTFLSTLQDSFLTPGSLHIYYRPIELQLQLEFCFLLPVSCKDSVSVISALVIRQVHLKRLPYWSIASSLPKWAEPQTKFHLLSAVLLPPLSRCSPFTTAISIFHGSPVGHFCHLKQNDTNKITCPFPFPLSILMELFPLQLYGAVFYPHHSLHPETSAKTQYLSFHILPSSR